MNQPSRFSADGIEALQIAWEDGGRIFCRGHRVSSEGNRGAVLVVFPAEPATPATGDRFAHEYGLREGLDGSWAVQPLELVRQPHRSLLMLDDPGGEPLERLLGAPIDVGRSLRLAIGITGALRKLHQCGLIHKDIKPSNILVNCADGRARLTGFGIASPLPRERHSPEPPELIAGTLAYMAPEQTGRMNRSVDSRSDLYAFGVSLYRIITGALPFTTSDAMELVHCHIAREPVPPSERLRSVPAPVSAIIMKLLAKTAEERYQTAAGVERDLQLCLAEWERRGHIEPISLGEHDIPDRLLIPEKLYGREREIDMLLAAFDRVVTSGVAELMLVSGYSGVGKSSVVNELHKVLVPPRGLFAAGKFDQYNRDVPYSTLVQAFQSLIRPLLGKSDTELSAWRDALVDALGPNGRLIVEVIPELKFIIGEQPPVAELAPQEAQRRFQLVFRRFIGVFAQPDHPLLLFLDDLQWLDAATLDLLEDVLTRSDLQHLLLVGAYRDNEVAAAHPLRKKLDAIKTAGGKIAEITLAPLAREHMQQLIADALRCEAERAVPLAQLVHEKTDGNPFFAIQFVSSLAEEGMLIFDDDGTGWSWDLNRIHAKGYTDNVVDLMVGKLTRLPTDTQNALQLLACLGNSAEITRLSIVLGSSEDQVHAALWPAVHQELVERAPNAYRFAHDRVQEAAYSLIQEELRAEAHLRIGRLLFAHISADKREEAIFDIVNQLNRGVARITSPADREWLAQLNLLAAKRAKASTAYASALKYLIDGTALLQGDPWERRHKVTLELELSRAECEYLTGQLSVAEERLAALSSRATTTLERATVACLRADVYMTLDQSSRAVAVCLDYLRHLGIDLPPHPTEENTRREYQRIRFAIGNRSLEELVNLPLMSDPDSLATLDVLTKCAIPALLNDKNLYVLVICQAVALSLEYGNGDGSCPAYEWLGTIAGGLFGDYDTGFQLGRLGYELVEQRGLRRFQARTFVNFGQLVSWTEHVREGRNQLRRAFDVANKVGDLTYAAYACYAIISNLLVAGDPLEEVQRDAERGLAFAQKMRFGLVVDITATQLVLVRMLRGSTSKFGSFDDEHFDEARVEHRFTTNPNLARAECWYWIRKLQACFFAAEYVGAVGASLKAHRLMWTTPSSLELAEYCFYSALSHAAHYDCATDVARLQHVEALAVHFRRLETWAEHCPKNFENRAALVGAEIARVERRDLDAMRLYEQAIRSARENAFIQNEGIANEVAARFYAMRGFEKIAHMHLREARHCYLRWGADGKVRQLDEMHPHLREGEIVAGPTSTIGTPVEHLDLATVIKVSQAVSGEMVVERLVDTVMRNAIEYAGAERGLLIVPAGVEQRLMAEATTSSGAVIVYQREEPVAGTALPESVLHYVVRTHESLILDDAAVQNTFSADPYIRQHQARSVLCLPLINQAKLIAVLYLENNLTSHVFTSARIAVLKLLASQAAISLENSRLYGDLEEREAKIRRLIDSSIIGIYIWDFQGRIIDANEAFLNIVGYTREDLISGRLSYPGLTPPEWNDVSERARAVVRTTGTANVFEKEYLRKDGSRVPILLGGATFGENQDQGVAFVLDLTERKRVEGAYRQVQIQLEHANRVATIGQLTASIAHEVNQPIAGVVSSGGAALRWLGTETPNLEAAQRAIERVIRDGKRAGDIIGRLRDLVKKAPPRSDSVNINEVIREVIDLTSVEVLRNGVSAQMELAESLPLLQGDRVQLQQVILNLVINAVEAISGVIEGSRELLISTGKADGDAIWIAVRDSGPGLGSGNTERVFEPFYTTKPDGIGMGLSICRSIIEAHGGQLSASANVPRGAVFQLTLPVHRNIAS